MENTINICFAADNNYAKYMGLALMSILKSAKTEDSLHFFILDNQIKQEEKDKIASLKKIKDFQITYLPIKEKYFDNLHTIQKGLSLTAYARFLVPSLIEAEKVLYLDCDVFVRRSLADLFNTDISNYYMAGSLDLGIKKKYLNERFKDKNFYKNYLNSGVLLINNKKWKEENITEKLFDYANNNSTSLKYSDQDCLNYILNTKKLKLSPTYNMRNYYYDPYLINKQANKQEILAAQKDPAIRHFKPWLKNNLKPFRQEYIEMMKQSPWAEFVPEDDLSLASFLNSLYWYWRRYPLFFLTPKFYIRMKYNGFKNTVLEVIE